MGRTEEIILMNVRDNIISRNGPLANRNCNSEYFVCFVPLWEIVALAFIKKSGRYKPLLFLLLIFDFQHSSSQTWMNPPASTVGKGWAANSVNTAVFRKNALCSYKNVQYTAYYDGEGFVVLGKRKLNSMQWETSRTAWRGNVKDAHNVISIAVDGNGYLHMAWDHHNTQLRYTKSKEPGSLNMEAEQIMTGLSENKLSYPEFYSFPGGDLLFLYRNGESGRGNLVINRYSTKNKQWKQLHHNLIDGEDRRNAYWQCCVDKKGIIHLSWVWRETYDVASNHDLCYARSKDGGITWEKSTSEQYHLPVTAATAEYVCRIPEKSELINQTSMTTTLDGIPVIATYWREAGDSVPQYHIAYKEKSDWVVMNTRFRRTPFSLSGTGTKRIPVSRPQVISWNHQGKNLVMLIFRDEERGSFVSLAGNELGSKEDWKVLDLLKESVGSWEPLFDIELWKRKQRLDIFIQYTDQADAEGQTVTPPQPVKIISVSFNKPL
jgi:BNR repeat-containing family member